MPRYFAHISQKGPVRYDTVPGSIGVLEAPDKPMPIGEAHCVTWGENAREIGVSSGNWCQFDFLWVKRTDTNFYS